MKAILLVPFVISAFLVGCITPVPPNELVLDLNSGLMNGVSPKASQREIKSRFPFYTGGNKEGLDQPNGGGGVFFINQDFYAYTYADCFQVRSSFRGRVIPQILNASRDQMINVLGEPNYRRKTDCEYCYYKRVYGCLEVILRDKRVVELNVLSVPYADVLAGNYGKNKK